VTTSVVSVMSIGLSDCWDRKVTSGRNVSGDEESVLVGLGNESKIGRAMSVDT